MMREAVFENNKKMKYQVATTIEDGNVDYFKNIFKTIFWSFV